MKRTSMTLAAVAAGLFCASALPARASLLDASNWREKAFNSTGVESYNVFGAPAQSGSDIVAPMPTDSANWAYSAGGGGDGYEAVEHLSGYQGPFVGDLSGKPGMAATFNLYDSNIASGAAFTTSDFGGELDGSGNPAERILPYLKSTTVADPAATAYGNLSEWWYTGDIVNVTSMANGVSTSIAADFTDLSRWRDIAGQSANSSPAETAAFQATLGQITSLGLSFGSGNFYSDGFGFSQGGTGTITLTSFAVPEPTSLGLLMLGGLPLLRRRRKHA